MAPSSMRGLGNLTKGISDRKAIFYFIGLMYPVTMTASLYYAFKGPGDHPHNFHVKHRSRINMFGFIIYY